MSQITIDDLSEEDKQTIRSSVAILKDLDQQTYSIIVNTKAPKGLPVDILGEQTVPEWVEDIKARQVMLEGGEDPEAVFEQGIRSLGELRTMSDRIDAALTSRGMASAGSGQTQNAAALEEISAACSLCIAQYEVLSNNFSHLTTKYGEDWRPLTEEVAGDGTQGANPRSKRRRDDDTAAQGSATKRRSETHFSRRSKGDESSKQGPSEDSMDLD